MLDRMERRWQIMTLEEVKEFCAKHTDEQLWRATIEDPMMVTSDFFSGKKLRFVYEDGLTWDYEFLDERHLKWKAGDGREGACYYNLSPAPGYENIYFLHHVTLSELPAVVDVIVDMESGYAVQSDGALGHPGSPREVIRTIRFGSLEGITPGPDAIKPCWTDDLTGRAIRWKVPGSPSNGIQYVFPSCKYLTYTVAVPRKHYCWTGTNPCDYIKLRDDLYIASTIEERQTGVVLVMLMNLSLMTDVQATFGIGGTTEQGLIMESKMHSGRVGSWDPMTIDLFSEE